jgi:hemerythrin-like metal-binding protein
LITWTEDMSVGVRVVDNDHKTLIRMLNDLNDGILAGHARSALEAVIEGLLKYTKLHFTREERLLADSGFPDAAAHKTEHDLLSRRFMNLQARFEMGQSRELSLEAMRLLKSWLTDHIQGSDQNYGAHLNAKGIT